MSSPQQQQPGGALRRESPTTPYGGGGVAVDAGRRRAGQGLPSHAAGRGGVGIAEEAAPARYPVQSILGAVPMADAVNAASAAAGTSATGAAPAVGVSTPGAAAGTAHYVMPAPVRGPNPFDLRGDAPGQAAGAGTPPRASVVAQVGMHLLPSLGGEAGPAGSSWQLLAQGGRRASRIGQHGTCMRADAPP